MSQTETSPPSALRNIGFYGAGQFLNMLVPLATMPIFTRLISKEDYGVVDMLSLVMVVTMTLGTWGLPAAYTRFHFAYSGDEAKQRRLLGTVVGFSAICMLVLCGIVLLVSKPLAAWLTGSSAWWLLLILIVLQGVLRDLYTYVQMHFRNREQGAIFLTNDAMYLGIGLIAALLLVVVWKKGVYGLFPAGAGLTGYGLMCLVLAVRFKVVREMRIDWGILTECLRFSWPLMAKKFVTLFNSRISVYVVGSLIGMGVLGVYGRANGLAYVVFGLMAAVEHVFQPRWHKVLFNAADRPAKSLGRLFTEYVCITTFPAACLILLSHEVLRVLVAAEYRAAEPLLTVLVMYYTLLAFQQIQGTVLNYLKMTRWQLLCTIISCIAVMGLSWLLIVMLKEHSEMHRAMGAAAAMLASGLIVVLIFAAVLIGRYRIGFQWPALALMYGGLAATATVAMSGYYGAVSYPVSLAMRLVLLAVLTGVYAKILGRKTIRNVLDRMTAAVRKPKQ